MCGHRRRLLFSVICMRDAQYSVRIRIALRLLHDVRIPRRLVPNFQCNYSYNLWLKAYYVNNHTCVGCIFADNPAVAANRRRLECILHLYVQRVIIVVMLLFDVYLACLREDSLSPSAWTTDAYMLSVPGRRVLYDRGELMLFY